MNEPGERSGRNDAGALGSQAAAVEAALATGDVIGALRAWHDTYGATMANGPWQAIAEAAEAYMRIVRASGSAAAEIAHARNLYLSALFRASSAGSLEGVLSIASAFAELGDDEVVAHSLRIARRLAGLPAEAELPDRIATSGISGPSGVAPIHPRSAA